MTSTSLFRVAALVLFAAALAWGQASSTADPRPTPIPGLTDKLGLDSAPKELLGEPYENVVAGVAFRPPAGAKLTPKVDPEKKTVAEFLHPERQWLLKVTQVQLGRPMALQTVGTGDKKQIGLLEFTVNEMMTEQPAAQLIRNEIVNVGPYGVGVAIFRFNVGTQRYLRQEAIFQANEKLYYLFNLTSPAAKVGKSEDDPNERLAAATFKQLLDSIQILDRSWIKRDQVERLFRTRALFVTWGDKGGKLIKDVIIPEQWIRIIKDGKDIGYSYVVEEFVDGGNAKANPMRAFDGVLISIRSRSVEKNVQADLGSQMYVSLDRRHEDWASILNVVTNKGERSEDRQQKSEFGFSELRTMRKLDPDLPRDEKTKNPGVKPVENYRLTCVRPKKEKDPDALVKPDLTELAPSPWYIPQAVGSLLPRMLPLNKPVTYMFQCYVSDQKAAVHRYIDVGFEKDAQFEGRTIRVIPITDRVGLDGPPTLHYMSPEGKYLGSVNEETRITLLPADAATLQKIWGDPNLKRQEDIQRPN